MTVYQVREWVDMLFLQRCASLHAAESGFARRECAELAIVTSELTSNILKYGVRGSIEFGQVRDERGDGLCIVAADCGPPFKNLDLALKDGFSDDGPIDPVVLLKRQGIGGGLGAVVRLTDSFAVEPTTAGKQIRVVRYRGLTRRPPTHRW